MIVNPIAGQGRGAPHLERVTQLLTARGFHVDCITTTKRGDAEATARSAAEQQFERVIVAAGDGTINEAVNGLAGTETALAIVPFGTGNVCALNLGIPRHNLHRAVEIAAGDRVQRLDVGRANSRHFLLMAGVGFDAHVVQKVSAHRKQRLRDLAYFVSSFEEFFRWKATPFRLTIDDSPPRAVTAWLAIIGNAPCYAWSIPTTPLARMNDGRLDFALFAGAGKSTHVRHVLSTFLNRQAEERDIEYHQVRTVTIETEQPWPVQLDGDTVMETPVAVEVRPGALRVMVP